MQVREDDTRTRILHAAGAIFAERGFEKATIREICGQAEVNLASVNYHFRDKERLYVEVMRHAHEHAWKEVAVPDWPPGTPPERKLRDFVRTTIQRMLAIHRLPWQTQLMMREFAQPTGVCRELADDFIRPHFQLMLSILDELVPAAMPPHRRHQLGFSLIGQCLFYKMNDPVIHLLISSEEFERHFTPDQLSDHIADVMLASLGRERPFEGMSPPDPGDTSVLSCPGLGDRGPGETNGIAGQNS